MTWKEMGRDNLVAAKSLAADARWRSSISRAYYAAFAVVSGELSGKVSFPEGRLGPSHDQLPKLVVNYLARLPLQERRRIATTARRLYRHRVSADYRPDEMIDAAEARIAVQDCSAVMRMIQNA